MLFCLNLNFKPKMHKTHTKQFEVHVNSLATTLIKKTCRSCTMATTRESCFKASKLHSMHKTNTLMTEKVTKPSQNRL